MSKTSTAKNRNQICYIHNKIQQGLALSHLRYVKYVGHDGLGTEEVRHEYLYVSASYM